MAILKNALPLDSLLGAKAGRLSFEEVQIAIRDLIQPNIIACVAGAYPRNRAHALDISVARDVIRITRTNACIIHIPRRAHLLPSPCIPLDDIASAFVCQRTIVPLINTSRAASAAEALQMVSVGLGFCHDGPIRRAPLIKLEILDPNLATMPDEMLACLAMMEPGLRGRTIPFLPAIPKVVSRAIEFGCPAVRIAAGRIGQRTGILDHAAIRDVIFEAQGVPVILEGGLDNVRDVVAAANLGARAVLINSAFALAEDPRSKATEVRQASDQAWRQVR